MTEQVVIKPTGIDEIDAQHAELMKCLDDLSAFVGGSYEFAAVFTTTRALLDYIHIHFSFEENLLRSWGYPDLDRHIAEHQVLEADVRNLWAQLESGDETLGGGLVMTIKNWIIGHINEEDLQYAKFQAAQQQL